ncbi:MAG TPA: hypothetical protein VMF07_09880, partial [Solirubrobacteraceae bacterium]|nr:hypothetical protein [Solirubrobacteraceae bacterium]
MSDWVRHGRRVWLASAALSVLGCGAIAEQARAVGGYGSRIVIGSGFHRPWGVGVDSKGDVFVADTDNKRVVEVFPDGTQATIAAPVKYPTDVAVD